MLRVKKKGHKTQRVTIATFQFIEQNEVITKVFAESSTNSICPQIICTQPQRLAATYSYSPAFQQLSVKHYQVFRLQEC